MHTNTGSKQNLKDRGYSQEALEQYEKHLKSSGAVSTKILNIEYRRDVSELEYPAFSYVFTLYQSFKRGVLPFRGPLADQPAKAIEIFETLEAIENNIEYERRKQQARDMKRQRNGRRKN